MRPTIAITPTFIIAPTSSLASRSSSSTTSTGPGTSSSIPVSVFAAANKKVVVQAAAAAADAASASVDAAAVSASSSKTRKRGRVSELTRKYRDVHDFEESILIGDIDAATTGSLSSSQQQYQSNSYVPSATSSAKTSTAKTCNNKKLPLKPSNLSAAKLVPNSESAVIVSSSPFPTKQLQKRTHVLPSYSRFPSKWDDALTQMCGSAGIALAHGFDRLRMDIENLQSFLPCHNTQNFHSLQQQQNSQQVDEITLLAHAACTLLTYCIGSDASNPCTNAIQAAKRSSPPTDSPSLSPHHAPPLLTKTAEKKSLIEMGVNVSNALDNFSPHGAVLLFNSTSDLKAAASVLSENLPSGTRLGVVGEVDPAHFVGNLVILVSPCNRHGNPTHIEHIEHVHYSNFNTRNWIIMMNSDLVGLSQYHTLNREPKNPLFMADYLCSYYVEHVSFPDTIGGKGGILRHFPRKWELYMSQAEDEKKGRGMRLVSEQKMQPSREKIQCEFWWRIERELERMSNV